MDMSLPTFDHFLQARNFRPEKKLSRWTLAGHVASTPVDDKSSCVVKVGFNTSFEIGCTFAIAPGTQKYVFQTMNDITCGLMCSFLWRGCDAAQSPSLGLLRSKWWWPQGLGPRTTSGHYSWLVYAWFESTHILFKPYKSYHNMWLGHCILL